MSQFFQNQFPRNQFFQNQFLRKSWWMVLFFIVCWTGYAQAMHEKKKVGLELKEKMQELQLRKQEALEEKEDLVLQIHSQSDPEWVEMVLKKRLGVVPEGQRKVYFKN